MASLLKKKYNELRMTSARPTSSPTARPSSTSTRSTASSPTVYPFLLIDRVTGFEGDLKCTAVKNVTINEDPSSAGHFPGHPVMPGVLQLEAMAQAASVLIMRLPDNAGKIGYFLSADGVKFRRPVVPGDTLHITAEITKLRGKIGQAVTSCHVNGETASEARLKFAVMDA